MYFLNQKHSNKQQGVNWRDWQLNRESFNDMQFPHVFATWESDIGTSDCS